jgi:acetyl esterase/lipase
MLLKAPLVFLITTLFLSVTNAHAEPQLIKGINYRRSDLDLPADDISHTQCQLDLSIPKDNPGFATIVWFHGGGLTGGTRCFAPPKDPNIAEVAVGYRLTGQAPIPACIEDAAAATAWVLDNIEQYGGDPERVYIGGHSAGGYLAAMIGMDPRWLASFDYTPNDLAGIIPVSGQVSTHFNVKKLMGDTGNQFRVIVDEYAPLHYAAKDLPPICLIVGDPDIEYKSRVEENELMAVSLRNVGHPFTELHQQPGRDHGTVQWDAEWIMPAFIERVEAWRAEGSPQVDAPITGEKELNAILEAYRRFMSRMDQVGTRREKFEPYANQLKELLEHPFDIQGWPVVVQNLSTNEQGQTVLEIVAAIHSGTHYGIRMLRIEGIAQSEQISKQINATELVKSWKLFGRATGEWSESKDGDYSFVVEIDKIEKNARSVTLPMWSGPELK